MLDNTKSPYILKYLFSFLEEMIKLKLIKYNKNLQNKLDISIENYKEIVEYPKYEYHKCTRVEEKKRRKEAKDWKRFF